MCVQLMQAVNHAKHQPQVPGVTVQESAHHVSEDTDCAQEGLSKVQTKFAPWCINLNQNQDATGLIHEPIKPCES